ncbi:hypothetical protein LP419_38325 [Massilia sp. H-1]|nr:hypothetical protein LP419_38325 [Massilia sp. H-1]
MPDEARVRLAALSAGLARTRELLDQLLALARTQDPASRPAERLDLNLALRTVLEDLVPLAEDKDIDLGVIGAVDAALEAHPVDLHMLIKNVLDNAIRYTPPGGKVDITLSLSAPVWCCCRWTTRGRASRLRARTGVRSVLPRAGQRRARFRAGAGDHAHRGRRHGGAHHVGGPFPAAWPAGAGHVRRGTLVGPGDLVDPAQAALHYIDCRRGRRRPIHGRRQGHALGGGQSRMGPHVSGID